MGAASSMACVWLQGGFQANEILLRETNILLDTLKKRKALRREELLLSLRRGRLQQDALGVVNKI